jgi:hypothetical protein
VLPSFLQDVAPHSPQDGWAGVTFVIPSQPPSSSGFLNPPPPDSPFPSGTSLPSAGASGQPSPAMGGLGLALSRQPSSEGEGSQLAGTKRAPPAEQLPNPQRQRVAEPEEWEDASARVRGRMEVRGIGGGGPAAAPASATATAATTTTAAWMSRTRARTAPPAPPADEDEDEDMGVGAGKTAWARVWRVVVGRAEVAGVHPLVQKGWEVVAMASPPASLVEKKGGPLRWKLRGSLR